MRRYTLVIKSGKHPSGWGLLGWMREKLEGYDWTTPPMDNAMEIKPCPDEWLVYVDTTDDLTTKLNTWFCEQHEVPYPGGVLLYWNVSDAPCRHGSPCGHCR